MPEVYPILLPLNPDTMSSIQGKPTGGNKEKFI